MSWLAPFFVAAADADAVAPLFNTDTIKAIVSQGPFGIGILVGCLVSYAMFLLSKGERKDRLSHELGRLGVLYEQLDLKEKRIQELHALLTKTQKEGLKCKVKDS